MKIKINMKTYEGLKLSTKCRLLLPFGGGACFPAFGIWAELVTVLTNGMR